jgi:hypothetical protein
MNTTTRHRGYVLVLTLALLVLAASVMVSIGRATLRHGAVAREAQESLQLRWGAASCRGALLPYVEQVLVRAEAERKAALPTLRASIELGGRRFDLVLSDESAKANVNAELDGASVPTAENRLRQALSGTGLMGAVKLRPVAFETARSAPAATHPTTQATTAPVGQTVLSFAQVFDPATPQTLLAARAGAIAPIELLTCWGNSALNVQRASPAAMKLALCPPLSAIDVERSVLDARKSTKAALSLGDRMAKLLPGGKAAGRPLRIAGNSTCHSLWVIGHADKRDYYSLGVIDQSDANRPEVFTFEW